VTLVGDQERDRAARTLQRNYVAGRLNDVELSERLDLVLHARSRWDLAYALRRLPRFEEIGARIRHALFVAAAVFVWLMLSAALFVAFVAWMIARGPTLGGLIVLPCIWLALTAGIYWRALGSGRQRHRF
jgi:hypothetical protein